MSTKPAITLSYKEPGASQSPVPPRATPAFGDIWGAVRIIDAEPDWTPRGRLEDSLALLIDGGTPNLCVYDYTNAQWLFAELSATRIP
jgi:hypothetical protein